jgi:hypothetical protein
MDNAYQELGQGFKSVCYPLQRQDALMKKEDIYLHKISDTLIRTKLVSVQAFLRYLLEEEIVSPDIFRRRIRLQLPDRL